MQKYKKVFIYISIIIVLASFKKPVNDNTEIIIKDRVQKIDTIRHDTIVFLDYELKNISNKTISIKYVKPDCICTNYEISNKTIHPNGISNITLVFNTKDKIGKQKINVIIRTDGKIRFYKIIFKTYIKRELEKI